MLPLWVYKASTTRQLHTIVTTIAHVTVLGFLAPRLCGSTTQYVGKPWMRKE